ncbi:MAG TPA: hypothetical protein VF665_20010, partial [Longimicrobium sp.]|uniref:protein kinase domain-containing protein n=1 Tax=Longimicrobium sp. TaxID=2029185 RepID=UPI002F16E5B8
KLLDFGIAQAADAAAAASEPGDGTVAQARGPHTPRYAAPEQIRGGAVTPACDVFALGLTALEMLGGRHPAQVHAAADPTAAARALHELRSLHPHLPRGVDSVLLRAVHPDPGRRFRNAGELVGALHPLLEVVGGTIHIRPRASSQLDPFIAVSAEPTEVADAPTEPTPAVAPAPIPIASPPAPAAPSSVAAPQPMAVPQPVVAAPPAGSPVPAVPASAAAVPADAAPEAEDAKPRAGLWGTRREIARSVMWAGLLLGLVAAWPAIRERLPVRTARQMVTGLLTPETPWTDAAEAEYRRVNRLGYIPGDTLGFQLLATGAADVDTMAARLAQLKKAGLRAGVGTRAVYPELGRYDAVLLAGPYTEAERAAKADELRRFQGRWSEDARPIRLVLRRGAFEDRPRTVPPSRVARAEYERLVALGMSESSVLPVRIAGSFADTSLAAARARLRAVRAEGLRGGIGDRAVYPQLDSGRVYVIIGPYRTAEMRTRERRIRHMERRLDERFRPRTLWMRDPQ